MSEQQIKPRKRKLYSPSDDEEVDRMNVSNFFDNDSHSKYRIVEILEPPANNPKVSEEFEKLWEFLSECSDSKDTLQGACPKQRTLERTAETNQISESSDRVIYSQLKDKLKITNELKLGSEEKAKLWQCIKFRFSNQTSSTCFCPDPKGFRMNFNSVEYIKKMIEPRQEDCLKKLSNHEIISSTGRSALEPSKKVESLNEENIKKYEEANPVQIPKLLPVLRDIFEAHSPPEVLVKNVQKKGFMFDERFIMLHLVNKVENEVEIYDDSTTTMPSAPCLSSGKMSDAQFECFFQSLADDKHHPQMMNKSLFNCATPSLSGSALKIKKNIPTASTGNQVIKKIIMKTPPKKIPSDSDDFDSFVNKKNVNQNNQRQQEADNILYKNDTNVEIQHPLKPVKLIQTKLIPKRFIEGLNKLSDKFKLTYGKDQNKAIKTSYHDVTNFSLINSNKPKLQLKSSTSQRYVSTATDDKENLREEKLKEMLKQHKNVSTYLDDFCRAKFSDRNF